MKGRRDNTTFLYLLIVKTMLELEAAPLILVLNVDKHLIRKYYYQDLAENKIYFMKQYTQIFWPWDQIQALRRINWFLPSRTFL